MKAALLALALCGCSLRPALRTRVPVDGSLPPRVALDAAQCMAIDNSYIGWSATSIAVGVLSGSGGLVAGVLPETTPRYITGGVSISLAALGAVSSFVAMSKARQYTAGCTSNVGGNQ